MTKNNQHPITWEQIGAVAMVLVITATVVLAIWKVGDLITPKSPADGHMFGCDYATVWVSASGWTSPLSCADTLGTTFYISGGKVTDTP